jgi:hypothetical protein
MPLSETVPTTGTNRRRLLRNVGLGAAALGGALAMGGKAAQAQSAPSVADVLNFALNLEYLEAEFYLRATTGHGLTQAERAGSDGSHSGLVWGGSKVPFVTPRLGEIAHDIATDEHAHVLFLRAALASLGAPYVACPTIDLMDSFTTLARAAGFVGPSETFDPFADENSFLVGAYIFEDVGVSAYSGAAGYLTGSPSVLAAAAGILAVEAYHGGAIRALLIERPGQYYRAADKISALRAALSGAPDDVGPFTDHMASITDSDSNSIAFARTPAQVLNVVYGGGAASDYLFFPDKLNGAVS